MEVPPEVKEIMTFKEQLIQKLNELFNNKNFAVLDDVLSADSVNRGPLGQTCGVMEFKSLFCQPLFSGFPDLQFVVNEVIEEMPTIVTRWTFSGTHAGEFRGYPPTNKKVSWSGICIHRINEHGRVYEMHYFFDSRLLYNQLSNVPASK
eukprot:m51a1_g14062 hypothetical protein (149) ;mRNA; r:1223873-1224644